MVPVIDETGFQVGKRKNKKGKGQEIVNILAANEKISKTICFQLMTLNSLCSAKKRSY